MRGVHLLALALVGSAVFVTVPAVRAQSSSIEARGQVDVDAFGPAPSLSSLIQTEATQPFTRSVVSVSDAQSGLFEYFASSDIGNLELKVSGTLTNTTATEYFGGYVTLLGARADANDIVTLTTTRTDPFDVTLQLKVDGSLSAGPTSEIVANSLITLREVGQLSVTDSSFYRTVGTIDDLLSITKTVSGPSVVLEIEALLSTAVWRVAPGDTVSGALSNTAFLSLILPSDVTIAASDSGTFGVPIPIPEPATLVLSAVGLLVTGAMVRRRRWM